jgi:hypothetical protein
VAEKNPLAASRQAGFKSPPEEDRWVIRRWEDPLRDTACCSRLSNDVTIKALGWSGGTDKRQYSTGKFAFLNCHC